MNLGVIAIVVSVFSLIATLAFGAPPWVNILGFACGIAGVVLLSRGRKSG